MPKKTVFITGGTGNLGWAVLQEMLRHPNSINIKLLVRKSAKNTERLAYLEARPNVRIIWGDMLDYNCVLEGVTGSDYVFHIGGLVSPQADKNPHNTYETNVGSAENIVKAVLSQDKPDDIKVCYIGTVAQTGGRNYPIHWGRCGDPIKISVYDYYAVTKTIAERIIVDSGIKNWVVLRQSALLYPSIIKSIDPIMFHMPLNGVLEWCTVQDAARAMCNLVLKDSKGELASDFWRHFYNVSSGGEYRISNYEFLSMMLEALGFPSPKKLFKPNWFAERNFHGHYFADGDKLEKHLSFRENIPIKEYFGNLSNELGFYPKMAKNIPNNMVAVIAKPFMKAIASTNKAGTLSWIENNDPVRINAFFGSKEKWQEIPEKWDDLELLQLDKDISSADQYRLDHGYDERKNESELDLEDIKTAAKFRGGECLSKEMEKGDLHTKLKWKCGHCGKEFEASPALILLGGHWCPECFIPLKAWSYNSIAKSNPFFAQVWYPIHSKDESDRYDFDNLFYINSSN